MIIYAIRNGLIANTRKSYVQTNNDITCWVQTRPQLFLLLLKRKKVDLPLTGTRSYGDEFEGGCLFICSSYVFPIVLKGKLNLQKIFCLGPVKVNKKIKFCLNFRYLLLYGRRHYSRCDVTSHKTESVMAATVAVNYIVIIS